MATISKERLTIIILTVLLLGMGVFFYTYLTKRSPVEDIIQPINERPQGLFVFGDGKDGLLNPLGITIKDGEVVVADSGKHRLIWFDRNGKPVKTAGSYGSQNNQLNYPVSLAIGKDKIFVADINNNRIVVLDRKGTFLDIWPKNSRNNVRPVALAIDETNSKEILYASDILSQKILVINNKGEIVRTIGEPGVGTEGLSYANGLAFDKDFKNLIVADSNNGRLQVFKKNGKHVKTLKKGYDFVMPRGVLYDKTRSRWLVVDTMRQSLFLLDEQFKVVGEIGGYKQGDTFRFPNSVAVDAQGRIYVVDRENNRVVVLK